MALCNRCHQMGHDLHKSVGTSLYADLYEKFCEASGWQHKPYPRVKVQKYVNNKKATR